MLKINISNIRSGRTFSGKFKTIIEANAWIDEQKKDNDWGKPERWLFLNDFTFETIEMSLEQREVEISKPIAAYERNILDEHSQPTGETENVPMVMAKYETQYKFACDYTIQIDDITVELEEIERVKNERKEEITEIKLMINDVDSSDKPDWEKKLLKRLIKEMRE